MQRALVNLGAALLYVIAFLVIVMDLFVWRPN